MKFDLRKKSLEASQTTIALQMLLLGLSVLANVALAWAVIALAGSGRTVVVPPSVEKSFWVEKSHASASYLEQMAGYVAYLSLQVSPSTVEYQSRQLLEYVSPASHGQLKQDMSYAAEKLRRENVSQTYVPRGYEVDEKRQSVVVQGKLTTYVNEKPIGTREAFLEIAFEVVHGKLYVKSIKEVNRDQAPAGDGDAGAVRAGASG
ncbi:type IV conjugative transfer system protein TraE [Ramlibacter humi]|uniref:type IV conjugative transfer system protein TraE n=1 Tax=Ramlibacter humi TaxID=2530451 RepID=UPI00143206D1|nr:type IV conjugative transfer system protein TraE [Ramlibacter humi]